MKQAKSKNRNRSEHRNTGR